MARYVVTVAATCAWYIRYMLLRDQLHAQLERRFASDPESAALADDAYARLRSGFYDRSFVRVFFHMFYVKPMTRADAYVFALLHGAIFHGVLHVGVIDVGAPPGRDDDDVGNNAKLRALQPTGFAAEFAPAVHGAPEDGDGFVWWNNPITVAQYAPDGTASPVEIDPMSVALEVGYTDVTTTFRHVWYEQGLARWPYDDTRMWLLFQAPDFRSFITNGADMM